MKHKSGSEESSTVDSYNALLTLLKKDEVDINKKKRKVVKEDQDHEHGHIEGIQEGQVNDVDEGDKEDSEAEPYDDNEGDSKDPFEYHFCSPDQANTKKLEYKSVKYPVLGDKSVFQVPVNDESKAKFNRTKSMSDLKIKYRLQSPFRKANGNSESFSDLQQQLAGALFNYQDMLYPNLSIDNQSELVDLYGLHILNHIYKTRDRVLKNNAKLASASASGDVEYRDQGFTRAKVLVLVPTRNACHNLVTRLSEISGLTQIENQKRFKQSFYESANPPLSKPKDFQYYFNGNTDDLFCLGIKLTRQAMKLYSSFYSSDIILASPLGLRLIIEGNSNKKQKADFDFLSSIEIVIIDQADQILMQTWDNVNAVFNHLNLIPTQSRDCDFSRVRNWYLDEKAKYYRQTVILSQYSSPEMNHIFSSESFNIEGKLKIRSSIDNNEAAINKIGLKFKQSFVRIPSHSILSDPDDRFKYFINSILPPILRGINEGTLIFVPSYMDFIRLRNYMDNENISCSCISEYTSASNVSRARTLFTAGRTKMLMITQRFHHYHRFQIKGVKQIVLYGLPDNIQFYKEVCLFLFRTIQEQKLQDYTNLTIKSMFSKWDNLKLERIVGSKHVGVMLQGINEHYDFY